MSSDSLSSQSTKGRHVKKNPPLRGTRLSRQFFKDTSSHRSSRRDTNFLGHLTGSRHHEDTTSYKSSDLYPPSDRHGRPHIQLENTYKLEPECTFPPLKVEGIIHSVLEEHLKDTEYDGGKMGTVSRTLADIIKEKVKALNLHRFKVISWVMICEKKKNSMRVASRGLWDTNHDSYACSVYENGSIHATGMVYVVYQD